MRHMTDTGPGHRRGDAAGRRRILGVAGLLAAIVVLAAGCGSGTSPGGAGGTGGTSTAAAGGASSGGTTVGTASGKDGTHLVDGSGRALYLWVKDNAGASQCSGACAAAWPPLTTKGAPKATGQAQSGQLGTVKRSDGSTQVTYHGWPLYYYAGDSGSGQTNGQGNNGFGAKWWLVSPAGASITGSAAPSSSGGGGYTY